VSAAIMRSEAWSASGPNDTTAAADLPRPLPLPRPRPAGGSLRTSTRTKVGARLALRVNAHTRRRADSVRRFTSV